MGRRGILGSRQRHGLPLGHSKLMGSLTRLAETNIDELLKDKNTRGDVDRKDKAKKREGIKELAYMRMLIGGGRRPWRRRLESSPVDLMQTQGVHEIQS
jgi:hypothetical protein